MATKKAAKTVKTVKAAKKVKDSKWLERLYEMGACKSDAMTWVEKQKSLQAAWDACLRTDWMIWFIRAMRWETDIDTGDYILSAEQRDRLRYELQFMDEEFGKRWKSRKADNADKDEPVASRIDSRHLDEWTDAERKQMCDFIRFYFPTPELQKR